VIYFHPTPTCTVLDITRSTKGPIFYLTEFERKMKENTKKCNEYSHNCGEIIHKCNNSA
jgi:hypothetical protein